MRIAIIVDVPDISVIAARCAVAHVEVIADGEDGLAGSVGRHIDRLQALVIVTPLRCVELALNSGERPVCPHRARPLAILGRS